MRPLFRLIQTVRRALSLLLMLFLLLSQQATLSHAASHWASAAIATSTATTTTAAASAQSLASDAGESASHLCILCVAAAQHALAVPASVHCLQPLAPPATGHTTSPSRTFQAATALAFRSRAPPRA